MITGFVYDPLYLKHDPGAGHPERAERLVATMEHLQRLPWYGSLVHAKPAAASEDAVAWIHAPAYIARARAACRRGEPHLDVPDVGVCPDSYEVALAAAGAGLGLADRMMAGAIDNGFSLIRPPGHHAESALALGFCLFNNIAILARHLQRRHGLEKILILDWDVHHGNGTQHTFDEDPSVLYVSLHQYPYYPGTGAHAETGTGRGEGYTLNCPLPAGSGDDAYERAFRERVLPAVNAYAPDAVLLSAGFDAHRDDPLADMRLSTGFYAWMSERMLEVADRHAGGRLLSLLEGGYSLRSLPRCVAEHLRVLSGQPAPAAGV